MSKFLEFILELSLAFILSLIISLPVMWLWNWLMPIIFGLIKINWLQSLGVCLLCGLLFNQSSSSKSN